MYLSCTSIRVKYLIQFTMSVTEDYINNVVCKVAKNLKIMDWEYSVTKLDSIGQNYFGLIVPVTVTTQNSNCKYLENDNIVRSDAESKLILKLAPTDERYRLSGAVGRMFVREIFVYNKLLTQYLEIQRNWPNCCQLVIPTVYYTDNAYCSEAIAMEDMTSKGYYPLVSKMFMDLEHITESVKALARLHALSFILKQDNPNLYSEISEVCAPLSDNTDARYFVILNDRLDKAIIKFKGTKHVALLEKLKRKCGEYYEKAVKLANSLCISHGDAWMANILFKCEENKPISCCLIDFQTARMASPAFDLLYVIISSTSTAVRKQHYHQLLDIYYQTFTESLEHKGLNSKFIYSQQQFSQDLKVVAPACLITVNTALWLANGLQQEGHIRSKIVLTTPQEIEEASKKYVSVVGSIIDDFYEYGYLPCDFC